MGIFAGALVRTRTADPRVVIPHPKLLKRMPTSLLRQSTGVWGDTTRIGCRAMWRRCWMGWGRLSGGRGSWTGTRTEAAWLESGSVLQALSRRVQSFRSGGASSPEVGTSPPAAASPLAVGASRRSSRASDRCIREGVPGLPREFGAVGGGGAVGDGEQFERARLDFGDGV
ncbi:hypothetical protein B0H16DRAFT_1491761 [Mycena metata]|uniref:Uncharacterized protein n=1 Tax=Mycena metata TaxID=1033252 RepID=A0AAD7KFL4_9AGAR|nr:hypothetical protein B0H16DRAFT_1491761 [Mycena metata]